MNKSLEYQALYSVTNIGKSDFVLLKYWHISDMTTAQIEAENTQMTNDLYRLLKKYSGLRNLIRELKVMDRVYCFETRKIPCSLGIKQDCHLLLLPRLETMLSSNKLHIYIYPYVYISMVYLIWVFFVIVFSSV